MSQVTIEVRSETSGIPADGSDPGPLLVELFDERVTIAELIRRTVLEQVRDLLVKRRLDTERARAILQRRYLTQDEVDRQTREGKIAVPASEPARTEEIDAEAEVARAMDGFKRGTFYVFVDGRQACALDDEVVFRPGSKVVFLRMVPLVGG